MSVIIPPDVLGLIGGGVTTCSTIPQIIRLFKLKSAHEISLAYTIIQLVGIALWLAYGIYFRLLPVIVWDAIATAIVAGLLFAKLKYGR